MAQAAGKVSGIAIRAHSGAEMQERESAEVRTDSGVEGDSRGRPGRRQVTVLSKDAWEAACAEVDVELPWTLRRANLLIEGIELLPTPGARLRVGTALLEVTGETDPCVRMDDTKPGLFAALEKDSRGGVCCRVIESGFVAAGDVASWDGA
jgi:MOSC domain-containing protein YiiM